MDIFRRTITMFLIIFSFQIGLVGCASQSHKLMKNTEKLLDEQSILSQVATEIDLLEARVAKAQASGISAFSSADMNQAIRALSDAHSYYNQFKKNASGINSSTALFFGRSTGKKALAFIETANAALARAETNKRNSDIILNEFSQNLKWLRKFNAPHYFPEAFADIESAHDSLVADIANGNTKSALNQLPRFLHEQKALEIVSAQRHYLHAYSLQIDEADQGDINRFAQQSYNKCIAALSAAKLTVAKNTRNEKLILLATAEIEYSIKIARAVARDMHNMAEMDQNQLEGWMLLLTTKLNETSQVLGAKDLRDQSILDQVDRLTQLAKEKGVNDNDDGADLAQVNEPTADAPALPIETDNPAELMSSIEQSLSDKVKALDAELKAMKAINQTTFADIDYDRDIKRKTKRRSLFVH